MGSRARKEATVAFSQTFPCTSFLPFLILGLALGMTGEEGDAGGRRLQQERRGRQGSPAKDIRIPNTCPERHLRCSGSGCVDQNSELYLRQKRVLRRGHFNSPGCFKFCAPTGG